MKLRKRRSAQLALYLAYAVTVMIGIHAAVASGNNYLAQEGAVNPSFYAHWSRGSLPVAEWYVEDYTSTRWPVFAAQIDWNRSSRLASVYTPGGTCTQGNRCVPARERRISPTGLCGGDFACFVFGGLNSQGGTCCTSTGHFAGGRTNHFILYNDATTRGFSFNERWATTCQEQGHATGLGHRGTEASCMFQDASQNPSHFPDGHDYFMLRAKIYNH